MRSAKIATFVGARDYTGYSPLVWVRFIQNGCPGPVTVNLDGHYNKRTDGGVQRYESSIYAQGPSMEFGCHGRRLCGHSLP